MGERAMTASQEVHLVKRPAGMPTEDDFALVRTSLPEPADGEVLVRNLYISVDPYMRPRLAAAQALDVAMEGGAIGRVEASRDPSLGEGDLVLCRFGFREAFVAPARSL